MYFESIADFIAMGGHGPYVWAAYGVSALCISLYFIAQRNARKRIERQIIARVQRETITQEK